MAQEEPKEAVVVESEEDKVRGWRFDQFWRELGFPPNLADKLVDAKVDWHEAQKLLKAGRGHLWVFEYLMP